MFWLALDQIEGMVTTDSSREMFVPSVVLDLQRRVVDRMRGLMLNIDPPEMLRASADEAQATIGPLFVLRTLH